MDNFTYQRGMEIVGLELLAAMHTKEWNVQTTPEQLHERMSTKNYFRAILDSLTEEDVGFIQKEYSLSLIPGMIVPVGLLETIAITTNGDYNKVSKDIRSLTNDGHWTNPSDDADTLILVDITVLPTRRGSKGRGEAKQIILSALQDFISMSYSYFWSYTPNIPSVKKWHISLGAEDTMHVKPNARPKYNPQDVNMMNYTPIIIKLRERSEIH